MFDETHNAPIDFGLDTSVESPVFQDENLFLRASDTWQNSRQHLFERISGAPAIRASIRTLVTQRLGLDCSTSGLRFSNGYSVPLDEACAYAVQHPRPNARLDQTCQVFGIAPGHSLHGLSPLGVLEQLRRLDLPGHLIRLWDHYWNSRSPGTPLSRRDDALQLYREYLQAVGERAFALGDLHAAQLGALRAMIDRPLASDRSNEDPVYVETVHLLTEDGEKLHLPGALVISSDSPEAIGQLLLLPTRQPPLQLFAQRTDMEDHLLYHQRSLWASTNNRLHTRSTIGYELPQRALDSAFDHLLQHLRQRGLAALTEMTVADLSLPGHLPLAAADHFDAWRNAAPLLSDAQEPDLPEAPADDPHMIFPGFGSLYHDIPFTDRQGKVHQQRQALQRLNDASDEEAPLRRHRLNAALDALADAQARATDHASTLLASAMPSPASPAFDLLKQAHSAGLRAEAAIQNALGLLPASELRLVDALLEAPVAGRRLDPVVATTLAMQTVETSEGERMLRSRALVGVTLMGHGDEGGNLRADRPVMLYWPGEGGGLQRYPDCQAMRSEIFNIPAEEHHLQVVMTPVQEDFLEHGLGEQLTSLDQRLTELRQIHPQTAQHFETARQALRDEALAGLGVPPHGARELARTLLLEQGQTLLLARNPPPWLSRLPTEARRRYRQQIEGYLQAVNRSQRFLNAELPPRAAFARQQIAALMRREFDMGPEVEVSLDLPATVRYQRDVIPGSGAPGTPVKLVPQPSDERQVMTLHDLALHNLDDVLDQRLMFMRLVVTGASPAQLARLQGELDIQRIRRWVNQLDLAGQYEQLIRAAFLGPAREPAFHAAWRQECLVSPWQSMLGLQAESAYHQQHISARGYALMQAALGVDSTPASRRPALWPVLLTAGGKDTLQHPTSLSGVTLIHDSDSGATLLYLPDGPANVFLREYDSLEAARHGLYLLAFDNAMSRYLAGRALTGNPDAHDSRIRQACIAHFDGIIGIGTAWPSTTSLVRHQCDAHMGRLVVAHRSSSRSHLDLRLERYALESGQVFDYIKMALSFLPFVGTAIAVFDAWTSANAAVEAFRRGDSGEALEQLESVLQCVVDALGDLLPGLTFNTSSIRQLTRQRLAAPSLRVATKRTAVDRFSGFESTQALSLNGIVPASTGTYRNIYRHPTGDFIVMQGRRYEVTFDRARHTWRLKGPNGGYRPAIALDESGRWDTHGSLYGVNIVGPLGGGGGAVVRMADVIDPYWPAPLRQHLPRWWTDPAFRRRYLLDFQTRRQLLELDQLNRQTAQLQGRANEMPAGAVRRAAALELVQHYINERTLADAVYPDLEELALLSRGRNLTRVKELQSRVAWLQVNRRVNELNTVKHVASSHLSELEDLIANTSATPATEVEHHLEVMARRKAVRIQIIEGLDKISALTEGVELWNKRITIPSLRAKAREDVDFALRNHSADICEMLKVRHYLEVINRYEAATTDSWFYLQRTVVALRVDVDRNLNNLFHLPEVRTNAEQRKRMLEASIDSFQQFRRYLMAWNTSYEFAFDQAFVDPLLKQLQSITDIAERWKEKIPPLQPAGRPGGSKGPSTPRKVFETDDQRFMLGVEENPGKPQQRFNVTGINNRTEVYVPSDSGRWRLQSAPTTPVSSAVDINRLTREAHARLQQLPAYREKVQGYARQDMLPVDLEHLMLSEAQELRLRADRIAEQTPDAELVVTMRQTAEELVSEGKALRIRQSLASKTPSSSLLDYLVTQEAVDIVKHGGLSELAKRIEGQADFLQEYEIRDLGGPKPRPLWYAHFHYSSARPRFERFTKAHLKTAEQRRLGLQWQLAQGDAAERIWRGDISKPMAIRHFEALFRENSPT